MNRTKVFGWLAVVILLALLVGLPYLREAPPVNGPKPNGRRPPAPANPERVGVPADSMPIWVIYGPNTSDFPGLFTVRRQHATRDFRVLIEKEPIGHGKTLEEARRLIPPGKSCLDRFPDDDPVIVETWL